MSSRPRRRISRGLIAVLVVLAAVFGTASYQVTRHILIKRTADDQGMSSTDPDGRGPADGQSGNDPASNVPGGDGSGGDDSGGDAPSVSGDDPGRSCPAVTSRAVAKAGLNADLKLLRYVDGQGSGISDAEAWICRNGKGVLFYQGHRRTGPLDAATGDDTILLGAGVLGEVTADRNGVYVAVNPKDPNNPDDPERTEYRVSAKTFSYAVLPDGDKGTYTIRRTVP